MASLNKVTIIGYVGKTPETKTANNGTLFCKLSVATTETITDRATGAKTKKTDWHNVVTFGKVAEICEKYISKGHQVYIEGKLKNGSYEKDGITHYTTDIMASSVLSLERRQTDGNTNINYQGHQPKQSYQQQSYQQQYSQPKQQSFSDIPAAEDDIPF